MFALDSLSTIASFIESQVRPGDSIGIAAEVLRHVYKRPPVKGISIGDVFLGHLKEDRYWHYRYNAERYFYKFYCQRRETSRKRPVSK
ncbi:MAG: hypothetical protein KC422_15440 [Trueperaceae bacterium]|nr:hypothetical protein [Trueperaceae bacterium]